MSSSTEEPKTKPVVVTADDMARIDRMADVLEKQTGGFFSKGRVVSRALDALDRELAQPTETAQVS